MCLVFALLSAISLEIVAFDHTDDRNVVIFPCGHESDAYWVHIAAAALAVDSTGAWAVWLTDAQKSLEFRPQRSKHDQNRLEELNRHVPVLTHKLVLQRHLLSEKQRPMIVVLHYGWTTFDFGLGLHYLEQLPEPTRHVFVTVFEADGPSVAMVLQARRMDEVWTTCYNNAVDFQEALKSIGTEGPPVYDIPAAMPLMNHSLSWNDPHESRHRIKLSFLPGLSLDASAVFLFVKRASYDSGLDVLLRAFLREFPAGPKAPQLILKLSMGNVKLSSLIADILETCPDCPPQLPSNVLVITDHLESEELEALYSVSDFSIEPTRCLGCMSVTDMLMMQRGRPHIGPAVNFCKSCRVHSSGNGMSGVFTVQVTDVVPAFSEHWLQKLRYADSMEHNFVEPDEADLRRQMRILVLKSRTERRSLGSAAAAAMVPLSDRNAVGNALLARLNALSLRGARGGIAPRLSRPWAANLWSSSGKFLPPPPPLYASWSSFVTRQQNPILNSAAALEIQAKRGRFIEPILSGIARNEAEWLARFLAMGCWDAARQVAMGLYDATRLPEAMVGLAVAWLNLGLVTPALISVEMAWELLRRPVSRVGHQTPAHPRSSTEPWNEQLALVTTDLHCAVVQRLPQTTWHYEYLRMWPLNLTACGIALAPTDANARALAHFRFLTSFNDGLVQHDYVHSGSIGHPFIGIDGARGVLHDPLTLMEDLRITMTTHFSLSFITNPDFKGGTALRMNVMEQIAENRADMLRRESLRSECDVLNPASPSSYNTPPLKWEGPSTLIEVLRGCHSCLSGFCSQGSPCSDSFGHHRS